VIQEGENMKNVLVTISVAAALITLGLATGAFDVEPASAVPQDAISAQGETPAEVRIETQVESPQNKLSYPGDCKASKMKKACSKNGCKVQSGGSHMKCYKGGVFVTLIPHSVKSNNSCRASIKAINANCK
jgi:hypothetical protein